MKILDAKVRYRLILLALVTLGVYVLISRSLSISFSGVLHLNTRFLLWAIIVTLPFPVLSALRWYYILRGMGIPVSFKRTLMITMGTWPLGILPGRVGDFGRALVLPEGTPVRLGVGSVLFEKMVDILVLLVLSALGLFLMHRITYGVVMLIVCIAALLCLYLLRHGIILAPVSIRPKLEDLYHTMLRLSLQPEHIVKIIAASAANWFLSILQVFFLFLAVGVLVPFGTVLAFLPLSIFVGLIPITLDGMGTRDSAMIVLFRSFATSGQSLTVGLWYSLLGFWFFALIGLPFAYLLLKRRHSMT